MNATLVTRDFPPKIGGVATYSYHLSESLQQLGAPVKMVVGDDDIKTLWTASRQRVNKDEILHVLSAPYAAFAQDESLVVTVHEPVLDELPHYPMTRKIKGQIALHLENRALQRAKRIIAVSNYVSNRLQEYGVKQNKVSVVPHAPDPRLLEINRRPPSQKIQILISGRLEPRKNLSEALRALARIDRSGYELVVTGEGPESSKLRNLAHNLNLPCRFLGALNREELLQQYSSADILLSTSHSEAFGLSIIEAMAAGCAVLASDIPSHGELVTPGEDGLLYREFDELVSQLKSLLQDSGLRETLASQARIKASRFSWNGTARKTLAVYEEVLASAGA